MSDAWSITDGYFDAGGQWHDTPASVVAALASAMGADDHPLAPPTSPPMWFVAAGHRHALGAETDIVLEDGTTLSVTELPPDLPLGYHTLHARRVDDAAPTRLVVAPRRCPDPGRAWGWATQLYALRSTESWGMGDLADLRRLATWTAAQGGGLVLINPLHATAPVRDQQPSPYFAASRVWRNPLYLRIEEVPGAEALGDDLSRLATAGRALTAARAIDRATVFDLKYTALERLFAVFERDAPERERTAHRAYVEGHGRSLARYATFCALVERHGPRFDTWPTGLRHPDHPEVGVFAAEAADRVRFHAWLQWLVDVQLAGAGSAGARLIADLAVGFEPDGADAWAYQDLLARSCRVGAPPDSFSVAGQDWGLPPFIPWKLRAAGYAPLIETFRAALAHVGGVRIDHVMGLFRLYWIPPGLDARSGAYVRYPADDLLDLLALEATRAGAFVVGEDLGTVEPEVRQSMGERNVLGNRLVLFERDHPRDFPEPSLATVTTHDLPTVAGLWTGYDLREQGRIGLVANVAGDEWFRRRLVEASGLDADADVADAVVATHAALAQAPSQLILATLDDACLAPERPNVPGTVDERPNWRIALPKLLEEIEIDAVVRRLVEALQAHRAG